MDEKMEVIEDSESGLRLAIPQHTCPYCNGKRRSHRPACPHCGHVLSGPIFPKQEHPFPTRFPYTTCPRCRGVIYLSQDLRKVAVEVNC